MLKLAVLSGKGGTGKTLLATNLAAVAAKATYLDCDVEEPNGRLFFKPESRGSEIINVKVPAVIRDRCIGCRVCVDSCRYNALMYMNNELMMFPDMCHSCGLCSYLCPMQALVEHDRPIGHVEYGRSGAVNCVTGIMNVKESSGIPIIKRMLEQATDELTIIDCPPGSACIVMESIKDADYCVLVSEPTTFGAANLKMVYELAALFHKPLGVVINKDSGRDNPTAEFCHEQQLPIIGRIAYDPHLAAVNSAGRLIVNEDAAYHKLFTELLQRIIREAGHETTVGA